MNTIEDIRYYMGGDKEDVPVNRESVEHLQYLIDNCEKYRLPKPEIFPWYGGDGVQAEWDLINGWYIEIDSSSKEIAGLLVKNRDYNSASSFEFKDIENAFMLVKILLEEICRIKTM